MTDIVKLAEASAAAARYYQLLGMQNTYGQTAEDRVASAARYRMAQDAWMKADQEYRDAVAKLSADELSAWAKRG